MKTRIVHTKIWQDDFFANLSEKAKLLFIYAITNPRINLSGIYELSDRVIQFDLNISPNDLLKAKEELLGKVNFYKGYVCVVNADKYGSYRGAKNETAKEQELEEIPEEIKEVLLGKNRVSSTENRVSDNPDRVSDKDNGVSDTSDTPRNHKSEIINQKSEKRGIVKGEGKPNSNAPPNSVRQVTGDLVVLYNELFDRQVIVTDQKVDKIRTRLKTFTFDQLQQVIKNCAASDFHAGKNDRGWVADLEFMFRSDEKTDQLLNLRHKERKKVLEI